MPLLIDGHNLIGKLHDLSLSDPRDEQKLVVRLRSYAGRAGKRVVVVFDPARNGSAMPSIWQQTETIGNVQIIWADQGNSADAVIRDKVANFKDRKGWLVVTSDNAVASFTRQCGVKIQSSEQFADVLKAASAETIFSQSDSDKPKPNRAEAASWSDIFKDPNPEPYKPKAGIVALVKPVEAKEAKRLRRNEQLRKQVENQQGRRLR